MNHQPTLNLWASNEEAHLHTSPKPHPATLTTHSLISVGVVFSLSQSSGFFSSPECIFQNFLRRCWSWLLSNTTFQKFVFDRDFLANLQHFSAAGCLNRSQDKKQALWRLYWLEIIQHRQIQGWHYSYQILHFKSLYLIGTSWLTYSISVLLVASISPKIKKNKLSEDCIGWR